MLPQYIEKKYVKLLGPYLNRFEIKKVDPFLANFRCPLCSDSKANKYKKRGYIYTLKDKLMFKCHNCNSSLSFSKFLKQVNRNLYNDMEFETYQENNPEEISINKQVSPPAEIVRVTEISLPKISEMESSHFAKRYVLERRLPRQFHDDIYYACDFAQFVIQQFPQYLDKDRPNLKSGEARLVLPFYDHEKKLIGITGRDLTGRSKVKYLTIKVDETVPKVFGLDRIDFSEQIQAVEGPIDSYFLDNCIATMDSNLSRARLFLGDLKIVNSILLVPDNEPRNKDVVREIKKAIQLGYDVCIWPEDLEEKDINQMICNGYTASEIQALIDSHKYTGLDAELALVRWSKISN
jgi:hypothetical protein